MLLGSSSAFDIDAHMLKIAAVRSRYSCQAAAFRSGQFKQSYRNGASLPDRREPLVFWAPSNPKHSGMASGPDVQEASWSTSASLRSAAVW